MAPFADLPDVLVIAEVAEVMRLTPKGIYNGLKAGTFVPTPFAERPHRWLKADLEKWLAGDYRNARETLKAQRRRRLKVAS